MNNKINYHQFCRILIISCIGLLQGEEQRGILAHFPSSTTASSTITPSLLHKPEDTRKNSFSIPELPEPPPIIPLKKGSVLIEKEEPKTAMAPVEPTRAVKQTEKEEEELALAKQLEVADKQIRFYFEEATLENIINYMETLFKITFLPYDVVKPILHEGGSASGHKITFKTNVPLSRQEAWGLFVQLLDFAGLAVFPGERGEEVRRGVGEAGLAQDQRRAGRPVRARALEVQNERLDQGRVSDRRQREPSGLTHRREGILEQRPQRRSGLQRRWRLGGHPSLPRDLHPGRSDRAARGPVLGLLLRSRHGAAHCTTRQGRG